MGRRARRRDRRIAIAAVDVARPGQRPDCRSRRQGRRAHGACGRSSARFRPGFDDRYEIDGADLGGYKGSGARASGALGGAPALGSVCRGRRRYAGCRAPVLGYCAGRPRRGAADRVGHARGVRSPARRRAGVGAPSASSFYQIPCRGRRSRRFCFPFSAPR